MTEIEFWQLVTRETSAQDQSSLADNLKSKLALLSDQELLEFDRIFGRQMRKSYSWSIWGAAYIITGCDSEYAFAEYRCFLISLGQEWYERLLANPDDIALLAQWPEKDGYPYPFLDEYDLIAGQIFEDRTGKELPFVPSGKLTPQGQKFTTKKKQLKIAYPQLSKKFPF